MVSTKVRMTDLIKQMGSSDILVESLKEVAPRLQDVENIAKELNLTENQLDRLQKKIVDKVAERLPGSVVELLEQGTAIEIPDTFLIYVHTSQETRDKEGNVKSTARLNTNGKPKKKLSIRTRKAMKDLLNS